MVGSRLAAIAAQWLSDHPTESGRWVPFHFVTAGRCVIALQPSGQDIALLAGDVVVLFHGTRHVVSGPTTPAGAAGSFGISARQIGSVVLKSNLGGKPETQMIYGRRPFE